VEFLRALVRQISGRPIHIIFDNYDIHKGDRARELLEGRGRRIEVHFLPTYSPWLSRDEGTCRVTKSRGGTKA
jgi:transposase